MTPQITSCDQLLKNLTVLRLVTNVLPEKKLLPQLNIEMANSDDTFTQKLNQNRSKTPAKKFMPKSRG